MSITTSMAITEADENAIRDLVAGSGVAKRP